MHCAHVVCAIDDGDNRLRRSDELYLNSVYNYVRIVEQHFFDTDKKTDNQWDAT